MSEHQSDTPILVTVIILLVMAIGGCLDHTYRAGPGDQQCQDYREVGGC